MNRALPDLALLRAPSPHDVAECPFCIVAAGGETRLNARSDIVCRTDLATALISPRWWPHNKGHVLVIANEHYENIYALPRNYGHAIHDLVQDVAIAMRASYGCQGISVRQHNEAAGNQDVWHYHVHVFPRFPHDELYSSRPLSQPASAADRRVYADKLKAQKNFKECVW